MKKRATLNFIVSLIYQGVNLIIGLLLPKYYTEIFGSIYNGLNQTVSQVLSLLSVLQFGIAAAAIQQMFKYIAVKDEEGIAAIYWNSSKSYRGMGYVFISLIIPIVFLFPYIIKENIPNFVIISFLLFRSVGAAMEYFFQAKYSVILTAYNMSFVIYFVNIILLLFSTVLHSLVLIFAKNILLYQAVAVCSSLCRFVIMGIYVKKRFPFLQTYKNTKKEIVDRSKRKDVLVSEVAGMIIDSTDLLVLTSFVGLVSASVYSVYNFVVAGLASVLSSCREAVFAGVGKLYYADKSAFKEKMDKFESIYLFLTFFLYSTALMLFRPFIETYTANMDAQYYYRGLPILFLLAKMLVNIRIPSIVAINIAGHFKQVKVYAVIEAAINLTISLILVKPLGIYGVLIGTIAGATFRTPILINYANKNIIEKHSFSYWKKILLWLPIFVISFILSENLHIVCSSLINWLIIAIIFVLIYFIVCCAWSIIIDKNIIKEIKHLIKKVFARKRK